MPQNQSFSFDQQGIALQLERLCLQITDKTLIDNLSFVIPYGKKVALVGLNGAGKSSLLRLLVADLEPSSGCVRVAENSPRTLAFKDRLGYQAANMQALPDYSALEYLQLCCQLKQSLAAEQNTHIQRAIQQWQLYPILHKPMESLSQGNLQKLFIAQAFLGSPHYILLDEPSLALDPVEQQRFIDNIVATRIEKLCLFSSHHINETVEAADLVVMLHQGQLVALLDLKAGDEFWLLSQMPLEKVQSQVPEAKVRLSYHKKNNLYCISQLSSSEWESLLVNLLKEDTSLLGLGEPKQALNTLFALTANEGL